MKNIRIKEIAKYAAIIVILTFVLYRFDKVREFASMLFSILAPFIAGGVIALFVNVPAKVINKAIDKTPASKMGTNMKWGISIVLAFILIILVVVLVFGSVVPDVIRSLVLALEQFPAIINNVVRWYYSLDFEALQIDYGVVTSIQQFLIDIADGLLKWLMGLTSDIVARSVRMISNIISLIVNIVLALIFCIYLLIFKGQLRTQIYKINYAFFKNERATQFTLLISRVNNIFYNYLSGLLVEAFIYGVLSFIVMKILNMPYAASISMINALFTFIPYFGPFFGGAIGAILIMTQSVKQAFLFVIMTVILQMLEGNIIYPRVVGNKVGLPAIWVMVSVSLGGTIAGLIGMLLAVPVCTFFYLSLKDIVDYRLMVKNGEDVKLSELMEETNLISTGQLEVSPRYEFEKK